MARLIFYRNHDELFRVNLTRDVLRVGRGPDNDVMVPDLTISRRQFCIEKSGTGWIIQDLSRKGLEVDGQVVREAKLRNKSEIRLALFHAVFELSPEEDDETTHKEGAGRTAQRAHAKEPDIGPVQLHISSRGTERIVPYDGRMVIGTAETCTVRLQDPYASGQHAVIEQCSATHFQVHDLRSRNGIYVGRAKIEAAQIPLDCSIRIGDTELTLRRAVAKGMPLPGAIYEGMISNDPAMHRLWEALERVAPSPRVVAITGESGTGKELVAHALHKRSNRVAGPFLTINCSSLSKELAESELFGHEKGAFTGADRLHKGAFEEAHGGTLFLDEVAELPLNVQAKLLRALESGEIRRVGSTQTIKVDVRVVVATNKDLRTEVAQGTFREDLYWRIAIHLALPPLRERRGDVALLIQHILADHRTADGRAPLSKDAEKALLKHPWPGNVRELLHTLHRAFFKSNGARIDIAHLSFDEPKRVSVPMPTSPPPGIAEPAPTPPPPPSALRTPMAASQPVAASKPAAPAPAAPSGPSALPGAPILMAPATPAPPTALAAPMNPLAGLPFLPVSPEMAPTALIALVQTVVAAQLGPATSASPTQRPAPTFGSPVVSPPIPLVEPGSAGPAPGEDPHVNDVARVFIIGKHLDAIVDEVLTKTFTRLRHPNKVAAALRVGRATVYRRIEALGYLPSDFSRTRRPSKE
jgi:transcriptional regulator with AAA-type ATPase domain